MDRTTPSGVRDYAIFLLIATYGLRGCDVVALMLDDVAWRARRLRIQQRKTGRLLWLPLTDEVATALLEYLRRGRPHLGVRRFRRGFQSDHPDFREIFLRCVTPAGALKATAIAEAFQKWSRRSGLNIASQGVHCLRHYSGVRTMPGEARVERPSACQSRIALASLRRFARHSLPSITG
ncbi:MAG: tyrosine-type recombinase/integrase, partial [Terriglobia bacterium]